MAKKAQKKCPHVLPRKQVLLLSCMDLRLMDDTTTFMNKRNLMNRYDQLTFAGAALGVLVGNSGAVYDPAKPGPHLWREVFFDQFQIAVEKLHREIKDVYILEHRNCGAYKLLPPVEREYERHEEEEEKREHTKHAFALAAEIREFCRRRHEAACQALQTALAANKEHEAKQAKSLTEAWNKVLVSCFLMNLDGTWEHLCDHQPETKFTCPTSIKPPPTPPTKPDVATQQKQKRGNPG